MFSRIQTTKSTESISANIKKLKEALRIADTVVIGAGAGLSTAAGFTYSGDRFENTFPIFTKNTDLRICIRVGFTLSKPQKNTGHTGADIFLLIAIKMRQSQYMKTS